MMDSYRHINNDPEMPLSFNQRLEKSSESELDNVYKGEWFDDKRQGNGQTVWQNPLGKYKQFDGHYVNDQFQGKGLAIYRDGSSYHGQWIKGERYGAGTLKYPDGRVKYDGNWKDDLFSGQGQLF